MKNNNGCTSLILILFFIVVVSTVTGISVESIAIFIGVGFIALILFNVILKFIEKIKKHKRNAALEMSDVDNMSGREFEKYISNMLDFLWDRSNIPSNDFGADVIASRNGIKYAIQCKRYKSKNVRPRAVRDAVGGKEHHNCDKSMVVTNSGFTKATKEQAESSGCELIGRKELADFIREYQQSVKGESNAKSTMSPAVDVSNTQVLAVFTVVIIMSGLIFIINGSDKPTSDTASSSESICHDIYQTQSVKQTQKLLVQSGQDIDIDGIWGPKTKGALKAECPDKLAKIKGKRFTSKK